MTGDEKKRLLILLGLAGSALALLYSQKETIMLYGSKALEAGNELLFKAALPSRAQPYSDPILQVARETGVDPFILFALGDRESLWGQALTPKGPGGTGDWTARSWGPSPMPPDGLGWGRGLMQLDYANAPAGWADPLTNIRAGAAMFQKMLAAVQAAPSGTWTIDDTLAAKLGVAAGTYPALAVPAENAPAAALAAYNAGAANVRRAYSAGGAAAIDAATTGQDYSGDVWARMVAAVAAFPA